LKFFSGIKNLDVDNDSSVSKMYGTFINCD